MSAEHGVKKLKRRVDKNEIRIRKLERRLDNLETRVKKLKK